MENNNSNNVNRLENLSRFAVNLNEKAAQGKLDPVIGRDEEIRRVLQILSRRTKNNPILVGEPGVGKTAISEGIAQKIVDGQVPENLKTKKNCGTGRLRYRRSTSVEAADQRRR